MNDGAQANTPKAEDHVAIPKKYITIAQTAGCLWLTAWAFFIFVASKDLDSAWIARLGQIGDAFGPLTSFLTVAALFTTATSTFVQIREFRTQLKEMQTSAREMEEQTRTYKQQLLEAKEQTTLLRQQVDFQREECLVESLPFFISRMLNSNLLEIVLESKKPIYDVVVEIGDKESLSIISKLRLNKIIIIEDQPGRRRTTNDYADFGKKLPIWTMHEGKLHVEFPHNCNRWRIRYRISAGHLLFEEFQKPIGLMNSNRQAQIEQLRRPIEAHPLTGDYT